jgi:hypothetical protein
MCSKERIDQSTDYRMEHKLLEKLIRQNLKRIWIKIFTEEENELHI